MILIIMLRGGHICHTEKNFLSYLLVSLKVIGTQWLRGGVLGFRPRSCGVKPNWTHCIVSFSKTLYPLPSFVQPRKTRPDMTEKVLTGR